MSHPSLLRTADSLVVAIDVQEPFVRAVWRAGETLRGIGTLTQGAWILGVPCIATTQVAAKLGGVMGEVARPADAEPPIDKACFSCCGSAEFVAALQAAGRSQIVLCGVETHICVSQTAHDLLHAGYEVTVVADAVSSRAEENRGVGLRTVEAAGARIACVEMALYEWMRTAEAPEFRQVLNLIK